MAAAGVGSVLIVDDDFAFRRSLARSFRAKGFEVDMAASAEEARLAVRERAFQLAVIDLFLGPSEPSGIQLISEFRHLAPSCAPFIVTSFPTTALTSEAMMVGAAGVLDKPVDLGVIERAIERWRRSLSSLDTLRWMHIHAVLGAHGGNKTRAARHLGCSRPGLEKMLRRLPPKTRSE
jgi:ActR/RegA family two-component response regulator